MVRKHISVFPPFEIYSLVLWNVPLVLNNNHILSCSTQWSICSLNHVVQFFSSHFKRFSPFHNVEHRVGQLAGNATNQAGLQTHDYISRADRRELKWTKYVFTITREQNQPCHMQHTVKLIKIKSERLGNYEHILNSAKISGVTAAEIPACQLLPESSRCYHCHPCVSSTWKKSQPCINLATDLFHNYGLDSTGKWHQIRWCHS